MISVGAFDFLEVSYFSGYGISVVPVVPVVTIAVCPLGYPRVVPFGAELGCQDVPYRVVPECSMTVFWHL